MAILTPMDSAALREKYRAERDKRLRPDGNDQYLEPTGRYAHYLDDPYVEPTPRDAIVDEVEFAFIGGGFAGLTTGAALKKAGVEEVRIIEKAGDFGGTWYWNRYPGAMCDTAAMVYMPLLEETGHMPSQKYVHAPEILEHCRRIGEHFGLYDDAVFSTEVTSLDWDAGSSRWVIRTNRGDEMRARFVAMGTGPLHRPKLPGIRGIETFEGHSFHTSRWDYAYTGGDPSGGSMTGLADKRVGIIGTGATSVQCIPHLSAAAGDLFVFQRTPSSIDIRNNHAIDPEWFGELEPGWQDEWLMNFTILQTGGFAEKDLVQDGWTDLTKRIRDRMIEMNPSELTREAFIAAYQDSDDEKMEEIRARVDEIVADPSTAEALKPWYRQLCKRPCFHDEYLQAYNNPNTHLIDTDGQGVTEITPTGVVAGGQHYELDCLVFASGFEVGTSYARRSGFETTGRNGLTLTEHWEADGMRSLHGRNVHGFPNLFIVGFSQAANLISNVPHNLVEAGRTVAAMVSHAHEVGATEVEVTAEAEQAWIDRLKSGNRRFVADPDCTPGYYNNEGQPDDTASQIGGLGFPDGAVAYFQYIDQWRSSGEFAGLDYR